MSWRKPALVLCLIQFVDVMCVTVVVAALPRMLSDTRSADSLSGPVVAAYAATFGSMLLFSARLGDRFGHRRIVLIGLALFAVSSGLLALSPSGWALLIGRASQGLAAALSVPGALALLTHLAPTEAGRRSLLGWWAATGGAAGASGLVVGGLATTYVGWRAVFVGCAVLGALLCVALVTAVRDTPAAKQGVRFGLLSPALWVAGLAAVVAGATVAESQLVIGGAVVGLGVVAVLGFVAADIRGNRPLLPPAAWHSPAIGIGALISAVVTLTTSPLIVLITLHLQRGNGLSPAVAGLMLLPFSIAVVPGARLGTRLTHSWPLGRVAVVGLALVSIAALAATTPSPSLPLIGVAVAIAGLGNGVAVSAAYAIGTTVTPALTASASGALNAAGQGGTALGTSLLLAAASGQLARGAFGIAAVGILVALLLMRARQTP